ncbi:hypothetical protein OCU04_007083 [Sclerotinia nivalis]|uniref:Uncharacterized protein n=1 Tax=Sclerotinia nivalis TaxID=352851 RepID=A0A9X0DIH8_9HELO|nr:hypothetical protein OCU04_007083 [Sclerotinia nivalis]
MAQNDWGFGGRRQGSLPRLIERMVVTSSVSRDEAEVKQKDVNNTFVPCLRLRGGQKSEKEKGEKGEKEEEEAKEESEDEESNYPSNLHPDDAIESIEEVDVDLTGRVTLFHAAYRGRYPYCAESHAIKWTEIAAHLTVEKVQEYDYYAFWADSTLVEVAGSTYLQQNLTEELWIPELMDDGPKSWCCGKRWCWGHGNNVEWI